MASFGYIWEDDNCTGKSVACSSATVSSQIVTGFATTLRGLHKNGKSTSDVSMKADPFKDAVATGALLFWCGHGSDAGVEFRDQVQRDCIWGWEQMAPSAELRVIVFHVCDFLTAGNIFLRCSGLLKNGVRYLLGFNAKISEQLCDRGSILAQYLNTGDSFAEAWRKACALSSASEMWARVSAYAARGGSDESWPQDVNAALSTVRASVMVYETVKKVPC